MKKVLFVFLSLIITFSIFSQSYEMEKERKFSFQIDPMLVVFEIGYLGVSLPSSGYVFIAAFEFQYALNRYLSLSIEPRFQTAKSVYLINYGSGMTLNAALDGNFTSFSLDLGFLYKPFGRMLKGWYVGLYPIIGWKNNTTESYNNNAFIIGAKAGSGYQWVFRNGFTIALGIVASYAWDIASSPDVVYGVYEKPLSGGLNFKLGHSF